GQHELLIRFGALSSALATKRPRPRWKTRLASHQQLRWIRTSLVGRMPGWSPPVAPVGPWRPIVLERWSRLVVDEAHLCARVVSMTGMVTASLRLTSLGMDDIASAVLCVGETTAPLWICRDGETFTLDGWVAISDPELWWPHTHGAQRRYPAHVRIEIGA